MLKGRTRDIFLLLIALGCIAAGCGILQQHFKQVGFIPIEVVTFCDEVNYENPDSIRTVVSPLVAEGFLTCSLKEIKRQLESLAWITKASVQRRWPNRLQINLIERKPLALWENSMCEEPLPTDFGVIDEEGNLFFPINVDELPELPRFTGNEVYVDDMVETYKMLRDSLQPLNLSVQQLSVMPEQGWKVVLGNGLRIILGHDEIPERLHRFVLAYTDKLRIRHKQATVVDLRYTNGLAVR